MKWKLLLGTIVMTAILALISHFLYPIPLLIILAPLIIGTFVIISSTLLHVVILIAIWIVIYIFVISKGIF